jgi:hypothetical protein
LRIRPIVRVLRFAQPGLHPHGDERRVATREQVREALLRRARGLARVEHERGDEVVVAEARPRGQPVLQRERDEALLKARRRDLRGLLTERARFGGGEPAAQRRLRDGALRLLGLNLCLLGLVGELFVDLIDGLVDERPGAEDDLDGVLFRELPARSASPALGRERGRRNVAGEAPLEPDQPIDVFAQHELLQASLDEHLDRLFAEVLIEALRVLVLRARARDERARRRGRLQPQREPGSGETEHDRHGDHQSRTLGGTAGERGEETRGVHS